MAEKTTGHAVVDATDALNLTGNIVPQAWYKTIINRKGRPEHSAILLLAEIVFWHRSKLSRDPKSKEFIKEKRFKADALQLNRGMLEAKFNISKRHVSRSLKVLEDLKVIQRERRTIVVQGRKLNNVLYIVLFPERLGELSTLDDSPERASGADKVGSSSCLGGQQVRTGMSAGKDGAGTGCGNPGRTDTENTPQINPERNTKTTTSAPDGADRREAPVVVVAGDTLLPSHDLSGESDCFLNLYRTVFPLRFQRPPTITQDDLTATADFFQGTDWNVLSVTSVMIRAWEKIGQRDPENGYRYPCCQHSKSLKKFFQHFETIVSDVQGENIPDADAINLMRRILKWYPDVDKDWLIALVSPYVCSADDDVEAVTENGDEPE